MASADVGMSHIAYDRRASYQHRASSSNRIPSITFAGSELENGMPQPDVPRINNNKRDRVRRAGWGTG